MKMGAFVFLYVYMKLKLCDWCETKKVFKEGINICGDCAVNNLRKAGFAENDLKIAKWGFDNGVIASSLDFNSLDDKERSSVVKEYGIS